MSLIAQLLLAGFLTAAIGANDATRASPHRAPPPEPCPVTLTVGHVVWHGHRTALCDTRRFD
jgi:hypothetical protein